MLLTTSIKGKLIVIVKFVTTNVSQFIISSFLLILKTIVVKLVLIVEETNFSQFQQLQADIKLNKIHANIDTVWLGNGGNFIF